MRDKDDTQLELDKVDVLANHLLRVAKPAHENFFEKQVQLKEETFEVHKSGQLEVIKACRLESDESWQSSDAVQPERSRRRLNVLPAVIVELIERLTLLEAEETENDLQRETHVDHKLKGSQRTRKLWEHEHQRRCKHSINRKRVRNESPDLWNSVLTVDDVPATLDGSATIDLIKIHVTIVIYTVSTSLITPQLSKLPHPHEMIDQFCLTPEVLYSVLLLHGR